MYIFNIYLYRHTHTQPELNHVKSQFKNQSSSLTNLIASLNNEYQSLSTTLKTYIYPKDN